MTALADRRVWIALARTFGPDVWAHRRTCLTSYAFRMLAIGATLAAPWPLKIIIDHVLSSQAAAAGAARVPAGHLASTRRDRDGAGDRGRRDGVRALAEFLQATTAARLREQLNVQLRDRMLAHFRRCRRRFRPRTGAASW